MQRCDWCSVQLRWWQRAYCRHCRQTISMHAHAGKGQPWCPRGSRANEQPDDMGLNARNRPPTFR